MLYHVLKEASSPLPPAPAQALVPTPGPWTYPGLDTPLRSQGLLQNKKRSAAGTITCAYIVVPPAFELLNALIRDLEESPPPLLLPPQKEVCSSLLLLFLFCLPLVLSLPKSSIRQKTKSHCS